MGMAIVFAVLLVGVLYVAIVGVSIDASGQRSKIAALLTDSLGREVRFEGAMQFGSVCQTEPARGWDTYRQCDGIFRRRICQLGRCATRTEPVVLLLLRLQIDELAGRDVRIRLQSNKDGSNNWTFKQAEQKKEANKPFPSGKGSDINLANLLPRLDIKRVSLEDLNLEFVGPNAKSHFFELQSLAAHFPAGEPLTLALNRYG